MVVMNTSNRGADFIKQLQADHPAYKFEPGEQDRWSARASTITYNPGQSFKNLRYSVLHELAHALLGHHSYQTDFELLKLETKAWELAAEIGRKYKLRINDEHIQRCLDTYRDWLHGRSRCPNCSMQALQQSASTYKCQNCSKTWRVSAGRFVRPYRQTVNKEQ